MRYTTSVVLTRGLQLTAAWKFHWKTIAECAAKATVSSGEAGLHFKVRVGDKTSTRRRFSVGGSEIQRALMCVRIADSTGMPAITSALRLPASYLCLLIPFALDDPA